MGGLSLDREVAWIIGLIVSVMVVAMLAGWLAEIAVWIPWVLEGLIIVLMAIFMASYFTKREALQGKKF